MSKSHVICGPCCQNESECARANFELQTNKVKNVDFGQISGFHKNELIKPWSSNPNAPNKLSLFVRFQRGVAYLFLCSLLALPLTDL